MKYLLPQYKDEFKEELDKIEFDYFNFDFNTSDFPNIIDYTYKNDIRKHAAFKEMFDTLDSIKTNCLYWFSVKSFEEAKTLKEIINNKKTELWHEDKTICRILPARNVNSESTIIYVGVRKGSKAKKQKITHISGRIVQHLGYYKEGRTQGLQLAYYTNSLNIDLTLHIYSLINCPDEYLYIIEKIFAKKLKPICGSH